MATLHHVSVSMRLHGDDFLDKIFRILDLRAENRQVDKISRTSFMHLPAGYGAVDAIFTFTQMKVTTGSTARRVYNTASCYPAIILPGFIFTCFVIEVFSDSATKLPLDRTSRSPNVLFIAVDDLNNWGRRRTPNISRVQRPLKLVRARRQNRS